MKLVDQMNVPHLPQEEEEAAVICWEGEEEVVIFLEVVVVEHVHQVMRWVWLRQLFVSMVELY